MKQEITPEMVEMEIAALREDADVKLYKQYERAVNYRKQYLYKLRYMRKKGAELRESGVTQKTIEQIFRAGD